MVNKKLDKINEILERISEKTHYGTQGAGAD